MDIHDTNIYENQFYVDFPSSIFEESSWNIIHEWLKEMLSREVEDLDKKKFISEILTSLNDARNKAFDRTSDIASKPQPMNNMLREVARKLESQYEYARKSLKQADYQRYTKLKEMIDRKVLADSMRIGDTYEEAWAFKPDKDIRTRDGYEPPWDWNVEQKDVRSITNYNKPWISHVDVISDELEKKVDIKTKDYEDAWDKQSDTDLKNKVVIAKVISKAFEDSNLKKESENTTNPDEIRQVIKSCSPHIYENTEASNGVFFNNIENHNWYHGPMSRSEAECLLKEFPFSSYLVRKSKHSNREYTLSIKNQKNITHLKIEETRNGEFILGQFSHPFCSIPAMVQHYASNKLPIKGAQHVLLKIPVPRRL